MNFTTIPNPMETIFLELKENNDADSFITALRQKRIPHLSFSQVAAVEFCPYRYYLQYVRLLEPHPTPDYFIKGKTLHQVIARTYQYLKDNESIESQHLQGLIDSHFHGESVHHLHNALRTVLENLWEGYEVVGIEQPFVMLINPDLPPCVGVIDLILRKGEQFIVVDHKTGRDFYEQDVLQMTLYGEYIYKNYPTVECSFYYDQYRWVNNLHRIRKPAFTRTPLILESINRQHTMNRMWSGHQKIEELKRNGNAERTGSCYICPYRKMC
jgi:hypothetical protein